MTAKEILYKKATEKKDGFMTGQVWWIVEAMEEYAAEFAIKELDKALRSGLNNDFDIMARQIELREKLNKSV